MIDGDPVASTVPLPETEAASMYTLPPAANRLPNSQAPTAVDEDALPTDWSRVLSKYVEAKSETEKSLLHVAATGTSGVDATVP